VVVELGCEACAGVVAVVATCCPVLASRFQSQAAADWGARVTAAKALATTSFLMAGLL
jgi:hypothetical protein